MSKLYTINTLCLLLCAFLFNACSDDKKTIQPEPTKAINSTYNKNIKEATTSKNLSKADLSWHALNTYGRDCSEVVSKTDSVTKGYFIIECSNGKKLRVYPRSGKHPKITNIDGGYN